MRRTERAERSVIGVWVVLLLGITFIPATPATASDSPAAARERVLATNRQLAALEPFVGRTSDGRQQLDAQAAAAHGASDDTLHLASEIIEFQRGLLSSATRRFQAQQRPDLAQFPRLDAFYNDATAAAAAKLQRYGPEQSLDITVATPCGDYEDPLPADTPPKHSIGPFASTDREPELVQRGYHQTAGYACGYPQLDNCTHDYTRGRSYGECAAPAFRDQATYARDYPGYIVLQDGEPNPELTTYDWPRWNWGSYVVWWHRVY